MPPLEQMSRRGWCPPLFARHDAVDTPIQPDVQWKSRVEEQHSDAASIQDAEEIQRVLNSLGDSLPLLSDGQIL